MKRISKKQKFWAILGAGLLVAAASGSAFAMQTAKEGNLQRAEIQQEGKSLTSTSPLPRPAAQPIPEPENKVEFTGPVEVMSSDMWVVGGRTIVVTAATEIKAGLVIGTLAKVHAVQQTDGSLSAREIEAVGNDEHGNSNSNDNGNDNSNANIGNDDNGNDNHGSGNVNSNDDNGNADHDGSNVNSNDVNRNANHDGSNVNSNDVNRSANHDGSNVSSNDDHGNNDHSSNGNAADDHGHNHRGSHSHSG